MSPIVKRRAIITQARNWLDTPYQHQASMQGAGCDCLGLVRGVWRHFYGPEPVDLPPYTPDWAEHGGSETFKDAANIYFIPIALEAAKPADIILFRMAPDCPAKHAAILSAPDRMIHAYWGRAVTETLLIPFWLRRRAYAYSFPNLADV